MTFQKTHIPRTQILSWLDQGLKTHPINCVQGSSFVVFCCSLVTDVVNNILQGCFSNAGSIIWSLQCYWCQVIKPWSIWMKHFSAQKSSNTVCTSKYHGIHINWPSIVIWNNDLFNGTVYHPTYIWANMWNPQRVPSTQHIPWTILIYPCKVLCKEQKN